MAGHIPQKWEYHWKYIPSESESTRRTPQSYTRLEFLELLNKWNRQGQGDWLYWE